MTHHCCAVLQPSDFNSKLMSRRCDDPDIIPIHKLTRWRPFLIRARVSRTPFNTERCPRLHIWHDYYAKFTFSSLNTPKKQLSRSSCRVSMWADTIQAHYLIIVSLVTLSCRLVGTFQSHWDIWSVRELNKTKKTKQHVLGQKWLKA